MELEVAGIAHLEASPEENVVRVAVANPEGQGVMLKLTLPVLIQIISALAKEGGSWRGQSPIQTSNFCSQPLIVNWPSRTLAIRSLCSWRRAA